MAALGNALLTIYWYCYLIWLSFCAFPIGLPDVIKPGKNFFLERTLGTWEQSDTRCSTSGFQLVTVKTLEKHMDLINFLTQKGVTSEVWIGLRRPDPSASFSWVDGSPPLFAKWKDDIVPLDGNCVSIKMDNYGTFEAFSCQNDFQAVCENPTTSQEPQEQTTVSVTALPKPIKKKTKRFYKVADGVSTALALGSADVRSRIECGVVCVSRSDCMEFTVEGQTCVLFSEEGAVYSACTTTPCRTYRRQVIII